MRKVAFFDNKRMLIMICTAIIFLCMICYSILTDTQSLAYADEETEQMHDSESADLTNENSEAQIMSSEKNGTEVNLNSVDISNFSNVHLIPNSNYFYLNPDHGDNDGSINSKGTCTTVAIELLMGYHNFYSDRRLIPNVTSSGEKFLIDYYGDIAFHPSIYNGAPELIVSDHDALFDDKGNSRKLISAAIGTADAFYYELIDLTTWAEFPGLGQNLIALKNAANKFVDTYSSAEGVNISYSTYSKNKAIGEINAGRPVVLAYEPVFSGAEKFHVIVAYGYATYNGQEGYIVHYGWDSFETQIWVPESWFGYQVTMTVNHTHNMQNTTEIYNSECMVFQCSTCGYREPRYPYITNTTGNIINGMAFQMYGSLNIPTTIRGKTITGIGNAAFVNQNNLSSVNIPSSVTDIGANAFENCINLTSVDFGSDSQLQSIGNSAFA